VCVVRVCVCTRVCVVQRGRGSFSTMRVYKSACLLQLCKCLLEKLRFEKQKLPFLNKNFVLKICVSVYENAAVRETLKFEEKIDSSKTF